MKQATIKRGQFLRELGLSSGALMAFYCLGTTMTACSTGSDPTPATPSTPTTGTASGLTGNADTSKGVINFALDLTNSKYAALKAAGGFLVEGSVIIANAKGTMVALSKECTHQQTTIDYRAAQNDFMCSNHGSEFSLDGTVKKSPAVKSLTVYKAQLSTNGNSLTVTA